ncbi:MAG: peptidylprolyl isomerase [Hyphomicrobiales bacterium]|nr:peptidylprolyl isomerase [Hyphomicrobiales bacterium]
MLDTLRKSVTGPFVKILIGVLILSFAVWGIQDIFGNYKKTVAIEIDDYEITIDELVTEYNNQISTISSQLDKKISLAESLTLGIDELALENLIRKLVLQIEINKLKIGIPDNFVAEKIVNDEMFQSNGAFNKARYDQLLSYAGFNEQSFLISEINSNKQNQLFNILANKTYIPKTLHEIINNYNNTMRKIEYTRIPKSKITVQTPSEKEMLEFYDKFKKGYRKSETRDFDAIIINPNSLKDRITVTPVQIENYFDENKDTFVIEENRDLYQYFFDNLAMANQFYEESKEKSIEQILTEYKISKAESHLGIISKDLILDDEVAEIAFNQPPNTVSKPIDGMLGISVIYVDNIFEATSPLLKDVYNTISQEIAYQEATSLMDNLYFEIEEEFLNGRKLFDVARAFDLNINNFKQIDINGLNESENEVDLIKDTVLLKKLFNTNIGDYIEVIETDDSFVWMQLISINEPYTKTFKNVRKLVTSDMIGKRKNEKESEIINQLKDNLEADLDVIDILSDYDASMELTAPFSRNTPIKEFTEDFNDRILSSDLGEVIIGKSTKDILIGKVIEIIPNEKKVLERDAKFNSDIDLQYKNDLFEQFLVSIEKDYQVKVYQENIDRLFNNQNL